MEEEDYPRLYGHMDRIDEHEVLNKVFESAMTGTSKKQIQFFIEGK